MPKSSTLRLDHKQIVCSKQEDFKLIDRQNQGDRTFDFILAILYLYLPSLHHSYPGPQIFNKEFFYLETEAPGSGSAFFNDPDPGGHFVLIQPDPDPNHCIS